MKGRFPTKREAERALLEVEQALDNGSYVVPTKQTLEAFLLQHWLPAMKPPKLRATTWTEYRRKVISHVVPHFGSVALQSLSPSRLNVFYVDLLNKGRVDGAGGLAPKTVRKIHVIMRRRSRTRCAGAT